MQASVQTSEPPSRRSERSAWSPLSCPSPVAVSSVAEALEWVETEVRRSTTWQTKMGTSAQAAAILAAILAVVREARPEQTSDDRVRRFVDWGPSPRAGQALMLACRARALLRGRLAPSLEDVEALAEPCLGHRMAMRYDPTGQAPALRDLIDDLARAPA